MKHFEKLDVPHAVYRIFSTSKELLYVGCSVHPCGRITGHGLKEWHREIAYITVKWYEGWEAGAKEEARAILEEKPKYNRLVADPANIGWGSLRKAGRTRRRSDGKTCPRCGALKENPRPGKAYCNACYAEYRRALALKKLSTSSGER